MAVRRRRRSFERPNIAWHIVAYVLSALLCWGILIWAVVNINPEIVRDVGLSGLYLPFFAWLLMTLLITFRLLLRSWWRSLWWSLGLVTFLVLRLVGLGGVVNAILIAAFVVVMEYYRRVTKREITETNAQ